MARADPEAGVPERAGARQNHPPKIGWPSVEPALSSSGGGSEIALRRGRLTRITFNAEDADGDALVYEITPVPAGATFDTEQGVLSWQPSRAQEGEQRFELAVNDGRVTVKRTFVCVVQPNRPPSEGGEPTVFLSARSAKPAEDASYLNGAMPVVALDLDGDALTFQARQLPAGARLVSAHSVLSLAWQPGEADIGEHELIVDVSDGELSSTVHKKVVVIAPWASHDSTDWLLLGGGPSAFLTHRDPELLLGGAVDITLVAVREDSVSGYRCAHAEQQYNCHASHHRFYGEFEVLDSQRAHTPSVFTYAAGYSASLEWDPARRYLIPHYGIELGGLVRAGLGHRAQTRPYLGLHLWASDSVWINATVGYRVVPAELLDLSGPTFTLRAILRPW
ncbi:MAG TPA: putative Ig domain-containing protein [Polyangiaceae bacterium]